jgi:hypothetical protein
MASNLIMHKKQDLTTEVLPHKLVGFPFTTLFITVLHSGVNPKALIIQRVIKEQVVPAGRKRVDLDFSLCLTM